jgi:flagellin
VVAKAYGTAAEAIKTGDLDAGSNYVVKELGTEIDLDGADHEGALAIGNLIANTVTPASGAVVVSDSTSATIGATRLAKVGGVLAVGDVITTGSAATPTITPGAGDTAVTASTYAKVRTDDNAFVAGETYVVYNLGSTLGVTTAGTDGGFLKAASADLSSVSTLTVGQKFKIDANASDMEMAMINSLVGGMTFTKAADTLTQDIEAVQAKINTARVQAGSQYAALESAVDYTTDLTAQYELGFNTVNDVNFSMETAHLAKNQILQQAATAMLAQANQGQQGLLQLIQG